MNKKNIMKQSLKIKFLSLAIFSLFFAFHSVIFAQIANVGDQCFDNGDCVTSYCAPNGFCANQDPNARATLGQDCDNAFGRLCQEGLNCGTDNKCYDPTKTNGGGGGTSSGGGGTNNGGGNVSCPDGLENKNGICLPKNSIFPKTGIAGSSTLVELVTKVIQFLLFFAGIIAVVFLVLGGYWYMASGGNEELAEKGKKTIVNFVLGLVVIIMAYAIVTILFNTLTSNNFTPQ